MTSSESIALWIQPRSHRNAVVGLREAAVVIRLTAPPVEGADNEALQSFVAERLTCLTGAHPGGQGMPAGVDVVLSDIPTLADGIPLRPKQ